MANTRDGDGQTALITGASTGIGAALAECFAKGGYDLILTARAEDTLRTVAANLSAKYNVKATPVAMDLGTPGGGRKLADTIAAQGLGVDVLVNNAGYGATGAMDGSKASEQLGMVDLNVRALLELTQIYWPSMLAKKRGGALNVASTAAFQPGPLMAVYYASKAFVLSFSEALWKEAQNTGVHVSCLCPGATESEFHSRAGTDKTNLLKAGRPMTSMAVAESGYRGFRNNKRVVIAGTRNAFLAHSVPFMPRGMVLSVAKILQSPA